MTFLLTLNHIINKKTHEIVIKQPKTYEIVVKFRSGEAVFTHSVDPVDGRRLPDQQTAVDALELEDFVVILRDGQDKRQTEEDKAQFGRHFI